MQTIMTASEITRLVYQNQGSEIVVHVRSTDENGIVDNKLYVIDTDSYIALNLHKGPVSEDLLLQIKEKSIQTMALKKAQGILMYSANSEDALKRKLIQKGFDDETAAYAVDTMVSKGFVDEYSDAVRIVEQSIKNTMGGREYFISSIVKVMAMKPYQKLKHICRILISQIYVITL